MERISDEQLNYLASNKENQDFLRVALTKDGWIKVADLAAELLSARQEVKKWRDFEPEEETLKEMQEQSKQASYGAKQAYINALEFELNKARQELAKYQWIPVSELPDKSERYIVKLANGFIGYANYISISGRWLLDDGREVINIVYFMQSPTPPEEG
jgi:hypothetical protein